MLTWRLAYTKASLRLKRHPEETASDRMEMGGWEGEVRQGKHGQWRVEIRERRGYTGKRGRDVDTVRGTEEER